MGVKFPETIYLQSNPYGEITWCEDQIDDDDVAYIREDTLTAKLREAETEIAALCERAERAKLDLELHSADYKQLLMDVEQLRARAEKAEADAERLRLIGDMMARDFKVLIIHGEANGLDRAIERQRLQKWHDAVAPNAGKNEK